MDVGDGLRKVVTARVACKLPPRSALNLGFSTLWLRIGLDLHGWVAGIGLAWLGLAMDFEIGLIWVALMTWMASLSNDAGLALFSAPPSSSRVDAIKTGECPNFFSNFKLGIPNFSTSTPAWVCGKSNLWFWFDLGGCEHGFVAMVVRY
ncbi:hypothetical protein SO802_029072 [Lithocarpus litseifolius]|uniref:Uncharacterized protein n=1 Tax=Lithocarpus litseifolius TaxID=425828 RepID=A0AAW2BU05_9ROSI